MVVPVWNRPGLVLETLDTVVAQTKQPAALVVVDDGSTDDGRTVRSVEAWIRRRSPPFPARLLRREHGGISPARNAGFAAGPATDWVAFLDADDLWPPDHLARCLEAVSGRPGAVAVTTDQHFVDDSTGEENLQDASPLAVSPLDWMLQNEPALCSSTVLRAETVERLGGFDASLLTGEDVALLMPLTLQGAWVHAPGAPVVYRRCAPADEDVNNSRRHADRFRRWARIYDEALARKDLRAHVDPALRARRLWWYWWEAGEELFHAGRRREARPCYRRALRYRKDHRRTWSRWLKCCVPRRLDPPAKS